LQSQTAWCGAPMARVLRSMIISTDSTAEGRVCPCSSATTSWQESRLREHHERPGLPGSYRSRVRDGVVGRFVCAAHWTAHEAAGAAAGSAGVRRDGAGATGGGGHHRLPPARRRADQFALVILVRLCNPTTPCASRNASFTEAASRGDGSNDHANPTPAYRHLRSRHCPTLHAVRLLPKRGHVRR
jgi:hypothetical protein